MASPFFDTVWELPRAMRAATQSQFYLSSDCIDSRSPWTQEGTPFDPFVQVFIADITPPSPKPTKFVREDEASWRDWQGFMTRLRGTSGRLRVVDYYRQRPAFDLRHDPALADWSDGSKWSDGKPWTVGPLPPYVTFAEAAAQDADSVVLQGLPASLPDVLAPADLCEARPGGQATAFGNLYEIVHATRTNSAGRCRVYLQPGLRQRFAAGDMMVLRRPTCVFRLADKTQGIVTRVSPGIGRLGFKLIEHTRQG